MSRIYGCQKQWRNATTNAFDVAHPSYVRMLARTYRQLRKAGLSVYEARAAVWTPMFLGSVSTFVTGTRAEVAA